MPDAHDPFGPPREWCDRRCERCPLASSCAVAVRERGRRWARQMRGHDPDDVELVAADMAADLQRALAMLEEIEAEHPDGLADDDASEDPSPVVSLVGRHLDESARAVMPAVAALADDARDALAPFALLLSMKAARVGSHVSSGALDVVWDHDAAPNVLLLDHQRTALRGELARLGLDAVEHDAVERALERFERVLDPLLARAEPHRAHLDALVGAGLAPSPFCTVPPGADEPANG